MIADVETHGCPPRYAKQPARPVDYSAVCHPVAYRIGTGLSPR